MKNTIDIETLCKGLWSIPLRKLEETWMIRENSSVQEVLKLLKFEVVCIYGSEIEWYITDRSGKKLQFNSFEELPDDVEYFIAFKWYTPVRND